MRAPLVLLSLTFVLSVAPTVAGTPLTYIGFIARADTLKVGETRNQIVAKLGAPTEESPTRIVFSLMDLPGFPKMPAPAGTQVYVEAQITLNNGRMVGLVRWAWIDTTGPAPGSH